MRIAVANDHAGYNLKREIKAWLEGQGHEVRDFGTHDRDSCDLSDFIVSATRAVACGECERGTFCYGTFENLPNYAVKYSGEMGDGVIFSMHVDHYGSAVSPGKEKRMGHEGRIMR